MAIHRVKLVAMIVAVLGLFEAMADGIVYVKASGSNTAPYDSEATAATTLDVAVNYAHANGIGKVKIVGAVDQTSQIALDNIEIFGDGWNSANLNLSKNDTTTPGYVIGENVFIHGMKMTANDTYISKLRALYSMSDASSVISNCWFYALKANTLNTGSELAGHVTAGLITHCLFSGCKSNNGGPGDVPVAQVTHGMGLLSLSGTARMANSIFTGNWQNSNLRGPCDGVLSISGTAKMENCVVYGNYTKATAAGDSDQYGSRLRRGGGIIVTGGSPEIRNCIVRNNKYPATPSDGNYPISTGEDIYSATLEGDFYIVPGSTPVIENCNVPEGQVPSGATNCQTSDPLFADPGNADFHVAANSPCVDAGKFAAWHGEATDYSGVTPRFQGIAVDIGVYEKVAAVPVMTLAPSIDSGYEAQTVTFTVGGNSSFPAGTAYSWTVDGAPYTGTTTATADIPLEIGEHTVSVTALGHFNASAVVTLRRAPGVMFTTTEMQTNGYKIVDFTPDAVEMEISEDAVYKWYWIDPYGAGAPDSMEKSPTGVKFYAGAHTVKLVVENADGAGATFSRIEENVVLVDPVDVAISVSKPVATGTAVPVTLAAMPAGFWFDDAAVYSWAVTNTATGAGFSPASRNPVAATFMPGTYDVYFKVSNANGDVLAMEKKVAGAVRIVEPVALVVPGDSGKPLTADVIQQLNLKTINGQSVIGEGNIVVEGSASYVPYEDVSLYGAVGDGVADDTSAVNAAIAAAKESGKPVRLPSAGATYAVSETIVVDGVKVVADANVTLATTAGTAVRVTGAGASMENLVISGAATGVEISDAVRATLKRVHVVSPSGDGIAVSASRFVRVENCVVGSAGANGLRFGTGVSGAVVGDSLFAGAAQAGVQLDAAVAGLVIETSQFGSNAYGIRGVAAGTIRNNEFMATSAGVSLSGGNSVKVLGNGFHFFNGAAVPVVMIGVSGATVEDNCADTIRTKTDYKKMTAGFMTFDGCADSVIRGNVVYQNEQSGGNVNLTVRNSTNVTVRANAVFPGAVDVSAGNDNVVKSANFEM